MDTRIEIATNKYKGHSTLSWSGKEGFLMDTEEKSVNGLHMYSTSVVMNDPGWLNYS